MHWAVHSIHTLCVLAAYSLRTSCALTAHSGRTHIPGMRYRTKHNDKTTRQGDHFDSLAQQFHKGSVVFFCIISDLKDIIRPRNPKPVAIKPTVIASQICQRRRKVMFWFPIQPQCWQCSSHLKKMQLKKITYYCSFCLNVWLLTCEFSHSPSEF